MKDPIVTQRQVVVKKFGLSHKARAPSTDSMETFLIIHLGLGFGVGDHLEIP